MYVVLFSVGQGLEIVDSLFCKCCTVQGTPHYSLLLSLLSLCLTPYTQSAPHYYSRTILLHLALSSFLSQWLFSGYLDEKEEFGIHSNHRALQCRGGRNYCVCLVMFITSSSDQTTTTGLMGTQQLGPALRPFSPDTATQYWLVERLSTSCDLSTHRSLSLSCCPLSVRCGSCQMQHPLCGQEVKCPPVAVATSIEMLEELTRQCQVMTCSLEVHIMKLIW